MSKVEKQTFTVPLHLVCAKSDGIRPVFEYIFFINGNAYASDAHILIEQSIEEYCHIIDAHKLNGHALHSDTYKMAMKCNMVVAEDEGIRCYTKTQQEVFIPYPILVNRGIEKIPDFKGILAASEPLPTAHLGISPKYLAIADKVLVHDKIEPVKCTLQGDWQPIIITVPGRPSQRMLWMPHMFSDIDI